MKLTSQAIVPPNAPDWDAAEAKLNSFAAEELVDSAILDECYELIPAGYSREGSLGDLETIGEEVREILRNDINLLRKAYQGDDVPWIEKSEGRWVCSGPEFSEDAEDSIGSSPFYAVARLHEAYILDEIGFSVID